MPRTRQGGPRGGTPGKAYPNRSDISSQPNLPARAATNQTYGKAQSQLQAQAVVPMAPPRLALPSTGSAPPGIPSASAQSPGYGPSSGPTGPVPGSLGDINRPSERPMEPVTNGAALGPGVGTEALGTLNANKVSDILAQAAQRLGSSSLQAMASRAQAAGQ